MKKLLDAFLDLPTWEGILLIAGAVCFVGLVATYFADIGFRRGVRYAKNVELWRKWNLR